MKSIIIGVWDAKNPDGQTSYLYHGITREQGIINFIYQYFKKDFSTWNYPNKLNGIHKSNVIKDRLLYDYTDDIIIYAQYN